MVPSPPRGAFHVRWDGRTARIARPGGTDLLPSCGEVPRRIVSSNFEFRVTFAPVPRVNGVEWKIDSVTQNDVVLGNPDSTKDVFIVLDLRREGRGIASGGLLYVVFKDGKAQCGDVREMNGTFTP